MHHKFNAILLLVLWNCVSSEHGGCSFDRLPNNEQPQYVCRYTNSNSFNSELNAVIREVSYDISNYVFIFEFLIMKIALIFTYFIPTIDIDLISSSKKH